MPMAATLSLAAPRSSQSTFYGAALTAASPRTLAAGSSSTAARIHVATAAAAKDGINGLTKWQSSCAVLSGQWATQVEKEAKQRQQQQVKKPPPAPSGGGGGGSSNSLEDKRGTAIRETFKDLVTNLPQPLSLDDLGGPPPSHGATIRVAYQGVPGAYSESAASKAYPGCEAVPCDQFEAAFQAVELWIADRAVLPFENSLGGSIHRNYDLLLRHRLHIVGEVRLGVHHCLLAAPGVRREDLRRVLSHPQALAQCEASLSALGVAREATDDTAGAAAAVAAAGLRDTAAVASARAAELYGLDILAEGIQDEAGNVTRFLVLAREPIIPRADRPFKTSVVFALEEECPGALFKALAAFSLRGIGLSKIESRPQRKRPLRVVDDSNHGTAKYFEYLFHVDFEASLAEPRAQNALGQLQESASFLRVLGSYPMDTKPVDEAAVVKSSHKAEKEEPPS